MYGIPEFRSVFANIFHTVLLFFLSGGKFIHMIHKLSVVGPGTVFLHSQCHPADHRIGCFRCFLCDLVGIGPELQSHSQNHDKTSKQQCHSTVHRHSLPQEDHSACDQRYDHCDLPCACQYCHTGRKQRPQDLPALPPGCCRQFQESQSQDSHTEAHGIRIKHGSHLPHRKQKYKGKQDRKSPASIPIPFRKITTGTCHQHHQNYIPQQNKIKRGHIHQQCHPKQNGKQKHRLQIIRIGQKIIGVFQFSPVRQIQSIPIDIGVIQQSILIPLPAQ